MRESSMREAKSSHLCPSCGYDLHGLPADHNCPECGFKLEHDMLVLKPTTSDRRVLSVYVIASVSLVSAGLRLIRGGGFIDWISVCMILWGGIYLTRYWIDKDSPQYLVMRSDGIHWRQRGKGDHSIWWSSIASINPNQLRGVVVLDCVDGRMIDVPRVFMPHDLPLSSFAEMIENKRHVASMQPASN